MSTAPIQADRIAYRPSEAAHALGLSRSRVYELMAEGAIGYRQVGSVRLIPRAELDRFLAGGPHEAA